MVGPWLFWLGPMIVGHISFSLLWHGIAFLFFLALRWLPMMIIGGVLGTGYGQLGGKLEELDTLRLSGMVTMMKFIRCFLRWLLAGRTACCALLCNADRTVWHPRVTTSSRMFCVPHS